MAGSSNVLDPRRLRLAWLVALPLLGACDPTEPQGEELEDRVLWWHPHTETWESSEPYRGAPAWSDDGTDAAGIRLRYERRVSFPPLQGWWAKRNFSFRVFIQEPGSWSEVFLHDEELAGRPTSLYVMSETDTRPGYVLVERFDDEAFETETLRVGLDGEITSVVRTPLGPSSTPPDVVPSPDGNVLASVACRPFVEIPVDGGTRIEPQRPIPCDVEFLDATTLTSISTARVELAEQPPFAPAGPDEDYALPWQRWTPDGTLVVTDYQRSAFAVRPGEAPQATAIPTCHGPETTSSKVDAQGRRLGLSWGGDIQIVDSIDAVDEPFGCGG